MQEKISTGSSIFDTLLEGGYERGILTTLFGPSGSGKSNLTLLFCATLPGKVLFIDTENSFSIDRFKQLCGSAFEEHIKNIIFLKPTSFDKQREDIARLKELMTDDINAIIVDGIAMLYRVELAREETKQVNNDFSLQLNALSEIAREKNIPVLLTSQVYADFAEKDKMNIVGGDLIKYASKCQIELKRKEEKREAILRKHRSLPSGKNIKFIIEDSGVHEKLEE